jgi:hypothetical protein
LNLLGSQNFSTPKFSLPESCRSPIGARHIGDGHLVYCKWPLFGALADCYN